MQRSHVWLVILVPFLPVSSVAGQPGEKKGAPGDAVFGTAKVVSFHLTMTDKQFSALTPSGGPGGFGPGGFGPGGGFGPRPAQPEQDAHRNTFGVNLPWSSGEVAFNGETFKDVGVRYKGNYTFLATARSLKRSLKIDLNRNVKGQKLDGLTMLNLNCGVSDPSKAREALAYAFFRDAGVPAPRTALAELSLTIPGKYDREYVGVYTLVEAVNKSFLKRHFKDSKGMLLKPENLHGGIGYLGTTWKAYEDRYSPEDPPTEEQKKRLIDFARLVSESKDDEFARDIGSYLDVEAFLRFIAANALLSNLDSYLGYGHNYHLYLVPGSNKFVFIPWDCDLSLATWPAAGTPEQQVQLSLHHPHAGQNKLIDRLFAIKEQKEKYLAIVKELTAKSFTRENLTTHLDALEKALKEPMAREAKAVAGRKEGGGGGFGPGGGFGGGFGAGGQFGQSMPPRRFIERRLESVAAQLEGKARGYEPRSIAGPGGGFGPVGGQRPPRPGGFPRQPGPGGFGPRRPGMPPG